MPKKYEDHEGTKKIKWDEVELRKVQICSRFVESFVVPNKNKNFVQIRKTFQFQIGTSEEQQYDDAFALQRVDKEFLENFHYVEGAVPFMKNLLADVSPSYCVCLNSLLFFKILIWIWNSRVGKLIQIFLIFPLIGFDFKNYSLASPLKDYKVLSFLSILWKFI